MYDLFGDELLDFILSDGGTIRSHNKSNWDFSSLLIYHSEKRKINK